MSLSENFESGRIGESVAFLFLKEYLHDTLEDIEWLNESGERGESFDILVKFKGGTEKKCEVKTRRKPREKFSNQWHISPKEIAVANLEGPNYFCVLIILDINELDEQNESTGSVDHPEAAVRGLHHINYALLFKT